MSMDERKDQLWKVAQDADDRIEQLVEGPVGTPIGLDDEPTAREPEVRCSVPS